MRFGRRLLVLGISLILMCLAAVGFAWNQGLPLAAFGAALPIDEDPRVSMRSFRGGLVNSTLSIPPAIADGIRDAGRLDPLAEEYVLLEALEERNTLTPGGFVELLEIVRKRNPRNRLARLLLVEAYLREGSAEKAAAELASFELLEKEMHPTLVPILKVMIEEPTTREVTIEAVQGSRLQQRLAQAMAGDLADPDLIVRLADLPEPHEFSREDVNWVGNVVGQYVRSGQIVEAQTLWKTFYDLPGTDLARVTDPNFSGFPGAPFGWRIAQQTGGLAELRDDLLQVTYYGRDRWLIAEQIMLLESGSYELSFELGSGDANLPNLIWRIECMRGGEALLSLPFREGAQFSGVNQAGFTVDAEQCPAQRLTLSGRPADRVATRSATISEVQISTAGAV